MAQWNKNTGDFLDQQRSLFEVIGVATSDGNIVSEDNPFPVSLGSSSITINGSITIPGEVEISNDHGNPIPTHAHIFDENDNEYGVSNPFPVIIGAGTTVDANVLNEVAVSGVANTVSISGTVSVGNTVDVNVLNPTTEVSISSDSPLSVSLANDFYLDLFGRLKVSNPVTLFDSSHIYSQDGDFDDVVVGSGSTVGFITAQSSATLSIGTTAGCRLVRQSKKAFSYQPGKSIQVLQTFVFNEPKENLTQRVGYGSSENGIFLEQVDSQVNIIKRTSVSGILSTVTIPQSEWNVDRLDGTGISTDNPSGIALDLTKAQILFSEYEWLGVGSVRVGFAIDGNFITAHQFNHANLIDSVYMRTATLPIRYEIENTGITTSTSMMKQICASVMSNGGYERKKAENIARRTAGTEVGTSFEPLVSIRLKQGREFAVVIPHQILAFPLDNNAAYEVALIKNGTLTGAAFTDIPNSETSNVEYDVTASTMTGGNIVNLRYVYGSNQAGGIITVEQEYNWDLQLGVTQSGVSDIYTVAARTLTGAADITGAIGFYDLT